MLEELVQEHNRRRHNNQGDTTMSESMVYIVFDYDGSIYGVYEEYVDAEERKEELDVEGDLISSKFHIEEYQLNKDNDPSA